MSLYLLDMDKLAIDLRKESVLKHFNKQDRIKIGNLCNNLIRYNKNGKPELNLDYIQKFKDSNRDLFDSVIRKTNTRIIN
jgi:hypothetical protein